MKTILKAMTATTAFLVLASCGRVESASEVNSAVAPTAISFSRDMRPVDGPLTRLDFKQRADLKWSATVTHTLPFGGEPKKEVIDGLECEIVTFGAGSQIRSVDCSIDARPVDGALIQITVKQDHDSKYEALKIVTFYDRIHGNEVTKKSTIGYSMDRVRS